MKSKETESSKWYLVYTKPKQEMRAKKNLENQGFEAFLPIIIYESKNKLTKPSAPIEEIMFPSYLFVKFDSELTNWTNIKSTKGVNYLVIFGQKLAVVPNQLVSFIQNRTEENYLIRDQMIKEGFQKNDNIVVKKGIFKNSEAIFMAKSSRERVRVLLNFLNKQIIAEIPVSDIGEKDIKHPFKL